MPSIVPEILHNLVPELDDLTERVVRIAPRIGMQLKSSHSDGSILQSLKKNHMRA